MEVTEDPRLQELRLREEMRNIPLAAFVAVVLILGVVGNSFSVVFYGFKQRLTVTNFFIAALGINDLLANLIFCDELTLIFKSFVFRDRAGCKTVFFLNNWIMINSVALLTIISVDRHRRICHPFSGQLSQRKARIIVVGGSLLTCILTARELFLADIVTKPVKMNDNSTIYAYFCTHTNNKSYATFIKASHLINIIIFGTAVIILIIAYGLIARKVVMSRKAVFLIGGSEHSSDSSLPDTKTKENTNGDVEKVVDECQSLKVVVSAPQEENMKCPSETKLSEKSETLIESLANIEKQTVVSRNSQKSSSLMTQLPVIGIKELNRNNNCEINEQMGVSLPVECNQEDTISVAKPIKENLQRLNKAAVKKTNSLAKSNPKERLSSKSDSLKQNFKAEKKITLMIAVFTCVSILSFMPYFGTMLFVPRHVSTEDNLSNMEKKIARQFYMLKCVVNPYIMCCFNKKFRRFIANVIRRRNCGAIE